MEEIAFLQNVVVCKAGRTSLLRSRDASFFFPRRPFPYTFQVLFWVTTQESDPKEEKPSSKCATDAATKEKALDQTPPIFKHLISALDVMHTSVVRVVSHG